MAGKVYVRYERRENIRYHFDKPPTHTLAVAYTPERGPEHREILNDKYEPYDWWDIQHFLITYIYDHKELNDKCIKFLRSDFAKKHYITGVDLDTGRWWPYANFASQKGVLYYALGLMMDTGSYADNDHSYNWRYFELREPTDDERWHIEKDLEIHVETCRKYYRDQTICWLIHLAVFLWFAIPITYRILRRHF